MYEHIPALEKMLRRAGVEEEWIRAILKWEIDGFTPDDIREMVKAGMAVKKAMNQIQK